MPRRHPSASPSHSWTLAVPTGHTDGIVPGDTGPGSSQHLPSRMTFHPEKAGGSTIIFVYLKVERLIPLLFCNVLTTRRCRII